MLVRIAAATAVGLAALVVPLGSGRPAVACSCAPVDPVDAIALVDAVFIGRPAERLPIDPVDGYLDTWRFEVEGVIKGDVAAEELVRGHNDNSSCGPAFRPDAGRVVVFATVGPGGSFTKSACLGDDPDTLAARLTEPILQRGTGPPAALRLGAVGTTDVAVLDAHGRAVAAALTGVPQNISSAVTCPGSTRLSIVTTGGQSSILVLDVATWRRVDEFSVSVANLLPDTAGCYEDGRRTVVANRDADGVVRLFSATRERTDFYEADPAYGSAVFHPAGTVILLPTTPTGLRTLHADGLTPAAAADVALPEAASIAHAAVSPDGAQLAMLGTLDGTPAVDRTPSTHVIVVDVVDGVPVAGSATAVALDPGSAAWPEGPARRLAWVDDATWAIEHVGNAEDWIEFVSTDGTRITPPTDVGIGEGLAPVAGGVLRRYASGVQSVSVNGSTTAGDPEPDASRERAITVVSLRGAADFVAVDRTPPPYQVSPPSASEPDTPTTEAPAAPAVGDPTDTPQPGPETPDEPPRAVLMAVIVGAGFLVVAAMVVLLRRIHLRS